MEPAFTSICEKNVSFSKELSEVKRGIVIAKLFKIYFINYSKKNQNKQEHSRAYFRVWPACSAHWFLSQAPDVCF